MGDHGPVACDFIAAPRNWRRVAAWALVGGLCLAALVAIAALLTGSFDDTDWRVVASSLGFSVFTSTAAAGGALRVRDARWARALGAATALSSLLAYALLLAALWIADDEEGLWRAFGILGLCALWTSHASLVLRALSSGDTSLVRTLTAVAVATLGIDTFVGILALLGALDDIDSEVPARVLAAILVVALLCTALVPILRRVAPAPPVAFSSPRPGGLAAEVAAAAERLAAMDLPPPARAEVARLRELARDAGA
jgi:hypothetical protein